MTTPMRIGVIGVGKIAEQYFAQIPKLSNLELVAVADVNAERADAVAIEQNVEALSVDDLLADDRIDAVLNLTIPAAHVEVGLRAIAAGKHVFAEKPLGLNVAEAAELLRAADAAGLRVGSAPDTVLGTGVQTARNLLDAGTIGAPVGASAHWSSPGHESWHPSPQFYYQPGGGPLFDMGPYYLTTLVTMFGPVVSVAGSVSTSDRRRSIGSGPLQGTPLDVAIDTHISAILFHESGVSSTVTMSFDIWQTRAPMIEIYGTAGTISVGDPNGALLQRLAAVRGRLSLCADQAAAAKWWLSMPMASVSAEGPMPKALSTRRTSPLMPGCRHQGRACPLRRARMTSNPLIVA